MAQKQVMSNVTLLGEIITMFLRSDGTGWANSANAGDTLHIIGG